jgi:predicted negative regulator of RcsB-dependent stress response
VDDYLTEQEQWERVKAWLASNGAWIIGGIALGALCLFGYHWYQEHQDKVAMDAAAQYQEIIQAFEKGDRTRGLALVSQLKESHGSSPYADQADLISARVFVESNELDKAAERLKHVMDSTKDHELSLVARLRLARVQLGQGKMDEALATLNTTDIGAFESRYHEARGDIYFAKGDKHAALREYEDARKKSSFEMQDSQLLDLKIKDLSGGIAATREPATADAMESKK